MLPNLFNLASKVIPLEKVQYSHFIGDEINSIGISVPTYTDMIEVDASPQPLGDEAYKELGLDFQKEYHTVYSNVRMYGINEQAHPDILNYHNKTWIVQKNLHWDEYNGWGSVLVVKDDDLQDGK